METIINQIHKRLLNKKKTVAVAESCTGGLVSSALTQLSGSSAYFKLGIVAYSNQAKSRLLGIPAGLITRKGAVCAEVARCMAEEIREITNSDIGIGITGIAGPTGGSSQKPVGTVFIAAASKSKTLCRKFRFKGNRTAIRKKATLEALKLLKILS